MLITLARRQLACRAAAGFWARAGMRGVWCFNRERGQTAKRGRFIRFRPSRSGWVGKTLDKELTKMLVKKNFWLLAGSALGGWLTLAAVPPALAGNVGVMPPLSYPTAKYLAAHPDAMARLLSGLPTRPADALAPTAHRFAPATGGTWSAVTASPISGLCTPELLTDGTVLFQSCNTKYWLKLTPDAKGNYADGTWSAAGTLPVINGTQYAPQYHAAAVLPDGRFIIMGGEYNGTNSEVWTNLGAIYDPVANSWTAVAAPSGSGWSQIGDAESTVLANGTLMLASCCADPTADALLDAKTLTWTATAGPTAGDDYQDEQGYELLPNGYVLTLDVWTNYPNYGATNAEAYVPSSGKWGPAGNSTASLVDPCGYWEIGPAVLTPNGTVVGFGANTGCSSPVDPTSVLSLKKKSWSAGPNVPQVCGKGGTSGCTLADAPAALEPNGHILFAASSGFGNVPTHFFEYLPNNTIVQVADPLYNASQSGAYYYNFLVLPTGQIMMTDFSGTAEIYTPAGKAIAQEAPVVKKVPTAITRGTSYTVAGLRLNGLSQGAYYGDDAQMATNYPLVRVTNNATGNVFYARTSGFSSMSVSATQKSEANFVLPSNAETGASTLVVVADGIASTPISVTVN